jgi:hypothetical protein
VDTDQFWGLIETARTSADDQSDSEAIVARAVEALSALPPEEITSAYQRLDEVMKQSYLHPLWAAAYVMNGGCSDDSFDYFRAWLMLQGRSVFEAAMADPDGLAELPVVLAAVDKADFRHEDALYIPHQAHEMATGHELPEDLPIAPRPDLDPAWEFDFDDRHEMFARLPRLTTLCWPEE